MSRRHAFALILIATCASGTGAGTAFAETNWDTIHNLAGQAKPPEYPSTNPPETGVDDFVWGVGKGLCFVLYFPIVAFQEGGLGNAWDYTLGRHAAWSHMAGFILGALVSGSFLFKLFKSRRGL